MECGDKVLVVCVVEKYPVVSVTLGIHVISGAVRATTLALASRDWFGLIDSFSVMCAREAAWLETACCSRTRTRIREFEAFNARYIGGAGVVPRGAYIPREFSVDDVYVMRAMEFFPSGLLSA
jgi:hypothetical protein